MLCDPHRMTEAANRIQPRTCALPRLVACLAVILALLTNDTNRLSNAKGDLTYIQGTLDYTDPGFKALLCDSYENMRDSGLAGLTFDYAVNLVRQDGGFEDRYAAAAAAYRTIFALPNTILSPDSYIDERNPTSSMISGMRPSSEKSRVTFDSNGLSGRGRCG